jgi:nitronate monooxygenase
MNPALQRAEDFCRRLGLRAPILLAPMAGACPPSLSIAVMQAGGLGAAGVLLMKPDEIRAWAAEVRAASAAPFQLNIWIPDPPPHRDQAREDAVRRFLGRWGPVVPPEAGDATPPDFAAQCAAMLEARPAALSSVMGLFDADFVSRMKQYGILWFAHVSTLAEARAAMAAGADVLVAQGMEAGGHRGTFDAAAAERSLVGLFALIPALVDATGLPVVAAGGITDGRGIAAALTLGASAVAIGTGFLRSPEAQLAPAWANALARTAPEDTMISRVFSGRSGRSIATDYVRAATAPDAPEPAPYPVQRGLTAAMRMQGQRSGDLARIQAWAGQSAALARAAPAGVVLQEAWAEAQRLLAGAPAMPAR